MRYFLVILLGCLSCQNKYKASSAMLNGRWVLDSTSGMGGKIISGGPRAHTEFTLQSENSFDFKWNDFDVFGEYNGTYSYQEYDERIPAILVFSIKSDQKNDSIIRRNTLIILNLTDSTLKTQEKETYQIPDSILITQDRINVYRKR